MNREFVDPNHLLLAAEAVAEDRGYEVAIEELWSKFEDIPHNSEQPRNAVLHVIGSMKRRQAEHGFYQYKADTREAAKA